MRKFMIWPKCITCNNDREKVLATVALTIATFFQAYPDNEILMKGSTKARTRLYRMAISKHLKELQGYYEVFGLTETDWQSFEKDVEYKAFLVNVKKVITL